MIAEEPVSSAESGLTATVSFPDGLEPGDDRPVVVTVPVRRSVSISKDLLNLSSQYENELSSGRTNSLSEVESVRSSPYGNNAYNNQASSTTVPSMTDSLPLERLRPRSKSAHQSNTLRRAKQLQKIPEVIQALRAPTATNEGRAQGSATEELYRSRLLRCNFLLKPDAAGYEYARRVQELSHATYSQLNQSITPSSLNNDLIKKDPVIASTKGFLSKFYKKFYEPHCLTNHYSDKFTTNDGHVLVCSSSPLGECLVLSQEVLRGAMGCGRCRRRRQHRLSRIGRSSGHSTSD